MAVLFVFAEGVGWRVAVGAESMVASWSDSPHPVRAGGVLCQAWVVGDVVAGENGVDH